MSGTVPEIDAIEKSQMRDRPAFRVGDTINVHFRIREGDKERIQVFKGVVIRKTRGGAGATFTVRKVSGGVGVERIFPLHSPRIEKLEVTARGHVRRSRLYYLRGSPRQEGSSARAPAPDQPTEPLRALGPLASIPGTRWSQARGPTAAARPPRRS